MSAANKNVIWFEDLSRGDVGLVGGKNSSLGEMVQQLGEKGIDVPPGFATTSDAFRAFIKANNLNEVIAEAMEMLDSGKRTLAETGTAVRAAIVAGDWPDDIREAILSAYRELSERTGNTELSVAVRSSATAEDLPGRELRRPAGNLSQCPRRSALLSTCRRCYASLFTDRAITYRKSRASIHEQVALSIGVQLMVRSDIGGSGVMFSIDTESGFDKVVLINAAWGLGENVVQGAVTPDEYEVFKPLLDKPGSSSRSSRNLGAKEIKMIYAGTEGGETKNVPTSKAERGAYVLSDEEILNLARQAKTIEKHYGQPMDMEWAKDGETGKLYIVQARPETVQSRIDVTALKSYTIKKTGKTLLTGLSVGGRRAGRPA
jgi:pyruvate,water dikinase